MSARGATLLVIPSDLASIGGLSVCPFQSVKRFGAVGIARQGLERSPCPDQRAGGEPDADAIREMHRDHLVGIAVSRMEQMARVGEQVELPHPVALARDAFAIHHVPESTHFHSGAVRLGAELAMVLSQQTRPLEEIGVCFGTANGRQIREVLLKGRGDSDHKHQGGRETRDQHEGQRAGFLRARNRELSPPPDSAAHPIDDTGMQRRPKANSGRRADSGNERPTPPCQRTGKNGDRHCVPILRIPRQRSLAVVNAVVCPRFCAAPLIARISYLTGAIRPLIGLSSVLFPRPRTIEK